MDDPHPLAPDDLDGDLPDDSRARIKSELVPGERLLWAARRIPRPRKGAPKAAGRALVWPVVLLMLTAAGLCFAAAAGAFGPLFHDPGIPVVIGGAAALFGFGLAAGNVQHPYKPPPPPDPARTLYALTDRRAVVWTPKYDDPEAVVVYTVARGRIAHLHRVEYPDGSGDVLFSGSEDEYWGVPGFEGVADVRRVEDLVRRTLVDPGPSVG